MIAFKIWFVLLFCGAVSVNCAKILGITSFPGKSHHILLSSLLKALAVKGHQVTMLSAFPLKKQIKNYEDIELTGLLDHQGTFTQTIIQLQNMTIFEKMYLITSHMHKIDNAFFSHQAVKNLILSKRQFDVVIQIYTGNNAYLAIPYYLGAHPVIFSPVGSNPMINMITGNPAPYSYVPNIMPPFPDDMNFLQRVGNTLSSFCMETIGYDYFQRNSKLLLAKYFPDAPSLSDLMANVSLILLNSHYSIESPRPYVPGMIQVGGLQLEEPKPLEGDLKEFMDSAEEGVIFFSLGSNVKSSDLSNDKLKTIIGTFAKLSMKVLWKFDTDLPDLPKNIKIMKWLPQRDLLAHPNLKLFVTHGGLLSTTEAIYHGVPMVGMPMFADQDSNVDDGVRKGYVVKVSYLDLTEKTLTSAIKQVLNNPQYRDNIQQRTGILRDQPIKPIDNAVFWVEYVLRHNGAHHLRTSAMKLKWCQYYLLDVLAFILSIILLFIFVFMYIVCKLWKLIKGICASNKVASKNSVTKATKKTAKLD